MDNPEITEGHVTKSEKRKVRSEEILTWFQLLLSKIKIKTSEGPSINEVKSLMQGQGIYNESILAWP